MNVIDKNLKTGLNLMFSAVFVSFALTACQKSQNSELRTPLSGILSPAEDVVVAKIGGTDVFYSDVRKIAIEQGLIQQGLTPPDTTPDSSEAAPMDAAAFNTALESVISQKLLAKDALRKGLDESPAAKRRFADARERLLSSMRVEAYIRETVTEDAMRKLYETQASLVDFGDEIRARIIVVETEKEAQALIEQLDDGADFETLAADASIDTDTRDRGGDLGYFTFDMLSPDFVRPIFKGKKGSRLSPFETSKGWHVAEIVDRRRLDAKSFEESREALRRFLTFDAIETLTRELRQDGNVKLIPVVDSPQKSVK